ncbi:MAG: M15 family metallopeptidase [Spirochaetia bacterium]|jgi:LAS superfamily LD-carboxypeptidase LdcB|nr:M15 family metallopeptidase [Spirochaetia bacterium]
MKITAAAAYFFLFHCLLFAGDGVYGNTPVEQYVTGRFVIQKHNLFVKLSDTKIPCDNKTHYLRKEAAEALERLVADFQKEHPGVPVWVASSTRSFYDQKSIWEAKWNGQRLVDGKKLNESEKDPVKRARIILKFSSMPGSSRHHWGTDVDFNVLTNSYYETGAGKTFYSWMSGSASKYGFHQPYTKNRDKGYEEEKWHWSYTPLSKIFLEDWNKLFDSMNFSRAGTFAGAEVVWKLAPEYVNAVNDECK